jgi:tetratricopeptide (TPR) repeat protein
LAFVVPLARLKRLWRRADGSDRARQQALRLGAEGDWDGALPIFERILVARRAGGGDVSLAAHDLATAYSHLGRYEEAIRAFLAALALEEDTPDHPHLSWTLEGLAAAHFALGEFASAAKRYRRALGLALLSVEKGTGHTKASVAAIADGLAQACDRSGETAGASLAEEKAESMREPGAPERRWVVEACAKFAEVSASITAGYRGRTDAPVASLAGSSAIEPGEATRRLSILERLRARLAPEDIRLALPLAHAAASLAAIGDVARANQILEEALRACAHPNVPLHDLRAAIGPLQRACELLGHTEVGARLGPTLP